MRYREKRNYLNLQKSIYPGKGPFDIPELTSVHTVPVQTFIGFHESVGNRSKQYDPENTGVHFFLDDYRFERIWNQPDKYVPRLKKYAVVLSPDFSTYYDFPKAIQIYNHYRKHWIGRYMQDQGILVIPTISWSDEDSFEWCFDGEPTNSWVAVSSVGCLKTNQAKDLFVKGYNEMLKRLEPEGILFFGKIPENISGNIVAIDSFTGGMY